MTQLIYDNLLASLYLLTWVVTLVWYHWRYHSLDAGSAIIGTYILYATSSILTLNDPLFSVSYNPLKVFPYIYLYVMLMIALLPIIYTHRHPSDTISDPSTRVLKIIAVISIQRHSTHTRDYSQLQQWTSEAIYRHRCRKRELHGTE